MVRCGGGRPLPISQHRVVSCSPCLLWPSLLLLPSLPPFQGRTAAVSGARRYEGKSRSLQELREAERASASSSSSDSSDLPGSSSSDEEPAKQAGAKKEGKTKEGKQKDRKRHHHSGHHGHGHHHQHHHRSSVVIQKNYRGHLVRNSPKRSQRGKAIAKASVTAAMMSATALDAIRKEEAAKHQKALLKMQKASMEQMATVQRSPSPHALSHPAPA